MLSFADIIDLLTYKFTGLRAGGFTLLLVAFSAIYGCFVWHKIMILQALCNWHALGFFGLA
jgi:hypothetical protein